MNLTLLTSSTGWSTSNVGRRRRSRANKGGCASSDVRRSRYSPETKTYDVWDANDDGTGFSCREGYVDYRSHPVTNDHFVPLPGRTTQQVSDVAEARGLPMAQVALAWMLSKPVVTAPIIGATKPHHLDDAVAAVSVQLTPDEIRQLEEAYQPHPVLGYS